MENKGTLILIRSCHWKGRSIWDLQFFFPPFLKNTEHAKLSYFPCMKNMSTWDLQIFPLRRTRVRFAITKNTSTRDFCRFSHYWKTSTAGGPPSNPDKAQINTPHDILRTESGAEDPDCNPDLGQFLIWNRINSVALCLTFAKLNVKVGTWVLTVEKY